MQPDTATPRISIITPSFNQAAFLEATLQSVLGQDYPNLQYIVVDGGSTDGSAAILERYRSRIEANGGHLLIESDRGQTDAINKGLRLADGDFVGWLCSDDLHHGETLHAIARHLRTDPDAAWIAGAVRMTDPCGTPRETQTPMGEFTLAGVLLRSPRRPFSLPQPGVLWRRSLHEELGYLRDDLHYCMDFEWYLRMLHAGYYPAILADTLADYRLHDASKTCSAPEGFLREHLLVEGEYARHLAFADRFRVGRKLGYQRRSYATRRDDISLARQVVLRPWWLFSQQIRAALFSRAA